MLPVKRASFLFSATSLVVFAACGVVRSDRPAAATTTAPTAAPTRPPLPAFTPPPVATGEQQDDYHGTVIADPYRWLEEPDSPATTAFVQAQNAASRGFLDALPDRARLLARLTELWNFPRRSTPQRAGERWFHSRNDGLQNQSVWCAGSTPDGDGELLLDPNTLSTDGTVALNGFVPSHDGALVAYATSASGSDWLEWHVLDTATKATLPDTLRWAKFSTVAWTRDGQGFFYQRFAAPPEGQAMQAQNQNAQLCYHRLGTDQSADVVVYARPDAPRLLFGPEVTEDGRFLIVRAAQGSDRRTGLYYADLQSEGWPVQPLLDAFDASYDFLEHDGDTFYLRTDKDAPKGRLVALDRTDPQRTLRTVVAEAKDALRGARLLGGHFVCHYLTDACSRALVYGLDGTSQGELQLPTLGSLGAFSGKANDPVAFVAFQSFGMPPTILRHDFAAAATTVFRASALQYDTSRLVTSRKFLQSHDGTRLCLFLVHKKGLTLDGQNPTYLYGYGGFNVSMTPTFAVPNLAFVEAGGVLAVAVLRGGGEYGEAWHRAGMREQKQNVFSDFIACAEYLQRNGFCDRQHLAIGGGSNGGLLVGACLTQRPDLFGAAIPEVGVLDMLRFHQFTIGAAWVPEYGSSDDKEQFAWLRAYSPLHNVKPGTHYPPTLVMTGDHDDRVLPGHSYKFAAALQQAQGGDAPIVLRIDTSAGHGGGKPVGKQIEEAADRWAFVLGVLGR